jgi:hypothetical protein
MGKELGIGEKIALAVIAAMRNDVQPLQNVIKELRQEGWDDYKIGAAFMDVGRVVFNPGDDYPELQEEEQEYNEEEI